MITRGKIDNIKDILDCVKEFRGFGDRLSLLSNYYKGELDILGRRRKNGLPNSRLVHNFPQYIVGVASGYLIGKPVQYSAESKGFEALVDSFRACNIDSVDGEVAECASIYGVGVEIVYADEKGRPKSAALDRQNAFVVYDDTVEHKPLAGVKRTRRR